MQQVRGSKQENENLPVEADEDLDQDHHNSPIEKE
jgi:hypothetical protein